MSISVHGSGTGSARQETPSTVHGWSKLLSLSSVFPPVLKGGYRNRMYRQSNTKYSVETKQKDTTNFGSYLFRLDFVSMTKVIIIQA